MTYSVERHLGFGPWGVTNPWVYADLSQPQRRRVPSKYVWQTHPPRQGMFPLGQIPLISDALASGASSEARARRMEFYALAGLTLSMLYLYRSHAGIKRNSRRTRRKR